MSTHLNERRKALLDSYKEQDFETLSWWFSEVENCADSFDEILYKDIFMDGIYTDALCIEFGRISTLLQNLSEDEQIEKNCELASRYIQDNQSKAFKMRMYFAAHPYPLCEITPRLKRVLLAIKDFFNADLKMNLRCVLEKFAQIRQEIQNQKKPNYKEKK